MATNPETSTSLLPKRRHPMSAEENKELGRRFIENGYQEVMRGNLDAVHQYFAITIMIIRPCIQRNLEWAG